MISKLFRPRPSVAWIISWAIIYTVIVIADAFIPGSYFFTLVSIGGIFLCFLYTVTAFPKDHFLQAALLLTFVADCILAHDNVSPVGLMIFFGAQLLHCFRLNRPRRLPLVVGLATIGGLCIALNFWLHLVDPLYVICTFYGITLLINIITAWRWHRRVHNFYSTCAIIGFILFACCDLCTGISHLSLISVLPIATYAPANFLVWFFYYLSQILVANSSKYATIELKEGKC